MTDYDKLYAMEKDALGAPYAPVQAMIDTHVPAGSTILDVGAGQGRDALPLARRGHRVTALDSAPHGLADITHAAEAEGLTVSCIEADITDWSADATYDVLLCNRVLHMLSEPPRTRVFAKLLAHVAPNGFVFLVDEPSNMAALIDRVSDTGRATQMLTQKRGDYFARFEPKE